MHSLFLDNLNAIRGKSRWRLVLKGRSNKRESVVLDLRVRRDGIKGHGWRMQEDREGIFMTAFSVSEERKFRIAIRCLGYVVHRGRFLREKCVILGEGMSLKEGESVCSNKGSTSFRVKKCVRDNQCQVSESQRSVES